MGSDLDGKFWLSALQWAVMIATAAVVWLRKPGTDAAAQLSEMRAELHERLATHEGRLSAIESDVAKMPTIADMAKLEGRVIAVDERARSIVEAMSTMRRTLERMEDFLHKGR